MPSKTSDSMSEFVCIYIYMSDSMPGKMSKHMSNRMWDGMRDNLSDRLPARTPNRMSEYMPDKMRNRISEFMLIYLFPWESHETKQFLQDISSTACIVNLFAFPSLRNHPSRTSKVRCCHSSLWPVFVWSLNDVIICFVLNDSYLYTYIYIYMHLILNLYMHMFFAHCRMVHGANCFVVSRRFNPPINDSSKWAHI